jgi:hypothetical protein
MSQALPNLKIGGGKFKEDGNAKKNRDQFLEKLISGSLEALDAKKKGKEDKPPIVPPPKNPDAGPAPKDPNKPDDGSDKPMDGKYSAPTTGTGVEHRAAGLTKQEQYEVTRGEDGKLKQANQIELPIKGYPDHFVLSNRANGDFGVWKRGFLGNTQVTTGNARDKDSGKYKDPLFRAAFNEVRANYINRASDTGIRLGYITKEDVEKRMHQQGIERSSGNQQQGGTIKPVKSFDKGGGVQKPWWDFLGWATGVKEVKKGTTGIYSDSSMGRIGEAAAQRNKMMKELGYEKGGSMFGTEATMVRPIEERVKALEEIVAATAMKSMTEQKPKAIPLRATPSSVPVGATRQEGSGMSSAAIINVIGSSGSQSIPVSSEKSQSTSDYISDPNPGGLAGVLCTSPWSLV